MEAQQQEERHALAALRARLEAQETVLVARDAALAGKASAVQVRDFALSPQEAEEAVRRKQLVRAGEELIARERDLDAEAAEVAKEKAGYEAGLAAMDGVLNEIADGTMWVGTATYKMAMARPDAVKAMRPSRRKSLMKSATRLVRLIHETEKRHAWLWEKIRGVKAWLGRDDLTVEARKDGEDIAVGTQRPEALEIRGFTDGLCY
ncbi:hypothetical protein [Thioclava sp.]|uniref:hypothetical protein n=1 Tax=Thioclava sp. TaxID=1933450 RepID=UPI003AA9385A